LRPAFIFRQIPLDTHFTIWYNNDKKNKGNRTMNTYKMFAESYRLLQEQGKMPKEEAERNIRVYEFLSECEREDLCCLVDSGAFNAVIRAYCEKAMQGAKVDRETRNKVLREMGFLFDETNASEVCESVGETL